jgi:thiosulfate/3-mercaptopyruvate sulfurtransferase
MIDVRSPEEYAGERLTAPGYADEGASRAGHIPTAASVPWSKACNEDQSFKNRTDLEQIYLTDAGLAGHSDVIAYCRIGERSSHTWFVLKYLLGIQKVRNYDGSWSEWGSLVKAPIALGVEPGPIPQLA